MHHKADGSNVSNFRGALHSSAFDVLCGIRFGARLRSSKPRTPSASYRRSQVRTVLRSRRNARTVSRIPCSCACRTSRSRLLKARPFLLPFHRVTVAGRVHEASAVV
jgi:hypothetical protein